MTFCVALLDPYTPCKEGYGGLPAPVCLGSAKVLGPTRVRVYRGWLLAPFLPPSQGGMGGWGHIPQTPWEGAPPPPPPFPTPVCWGFA